VSLAPGEGAALLRVEDDPAEAARWSLRELFAEAEYVAALASRGGPRLAPALSGVAGAGPRLTRG
jgi:hypothetical protein